MAPAGKKRKTDMPLPNYMVKALECPVCWETIKDPPIFLCEKGHGMCQTCRDPLKAQDQPCPVCRCKLSETRNLVAEEILEQLPKIKCKNNGCTFKRADNQLVKKHEEDCRERPVKCEDCQEPFDYFKCLIQSTSFMLKLLTSKDSHHCADWEFFYEND